MALISLSLSGQSARSPLSSGLCQADTAIDGRGGFWLKPIGKPADKAYASFPFGPARLGHLNRGGHFFAPARATERGSADGEAPC